VDTQAQSKPEAEAWLSLIVDNCAHETYDVVAAHDLEGEEAATSYAAYLVSWSKTADEGMILRKVRNKYPSMEVALSQLNKQVEFSVAMVMEGNKEGDVVGKGELEKLVLQE
jgi:hypothetical protein